MLSIFESIFVGEMSVYGETLVGPPLLTARAIPVASLISDRATLNDVLQLHACYLNVRDGDLRPVASDWSLRYLWTLLPPVAAAISVLHHSLPVCAEQIAIELDTCSAPLRFHIEHEGHPACESETFTRYHILLEQHLTPLFGAISDLTRLPKKVLWGNAARYLEIVLDQALLLTENAPHVLADKIALLQASKLPDGRRNPLYAARRKVTQIHNDKPVSLILHRQCCLAHLLPNQDYCGACPLAPQFQKSMETVSSV